jgi:mono/diheme cytochrome c family protein
MNGTRRLFLDHGVASRRVLWVLGVLLLLAACGAWFLRGPGPMAFAAGNGTRPSDYRGADPTGVPASLAQAPLISRGEYLARAADCVVCHTARGGALFAGGFPFVLPFGTLYSTNITPDEQTGIGSYSDAQFLAALRHGVRRDGANLYPAMPFTSYTYMTDADGLAIKAYLFTLAPIVAPARKNTLEFPFDQRWGMAAWSLLFNADTRFEPNASQSAEWNRGAYLAEALAHCGECHTPRNVAFALNHRKKFGGALTAGWKAYNVSADAGAGVGAWTDAELLSYLGTGHAAGRGSAAGPMGEAVDESFSRMAPEDLKALVVYLRSVPAVPSPDLPAKLAAVAPASHREGGGADDPRGKALFAGACASCHGWSGASSLSAFATLTGARSVNDPGGTNVAQIVISGMRRTTPAGTLSMPSFGSSYSDTEIAAVSNFVTARFGSSRSSLSTKDVAKLRKQAAD